MSAASYMVQVRAEGQWAKDSTHAAKGPALAAAQALLKNRDAVRIVEQAKGGATKVVYQDERDRDKVALKLGEIDAAPLCAAITDYYSATARRVAVKLFRQYLASRAITAYELVHDCRHLSALAAKSGLVAQAAHRVAAIQARQSGIKHKDRIEELNRVLPQMIKLCESVGDVVPFAAALETGGVAQAWAAVEAHAKKGAQALAFGAAVSTFLNEASDWGAKCIRLAALLERDSSDQALALVDDILAELIDAVANLPVALGSTADPAGALTALARIAAGTYEAPAGQEQAGSIATLARLCREKPLPLTRAALLEPVVAALRGTKPLTKLGPAEDYKAFFALLAGIKQPGGILGGGAMAEAVVRRIRTVMGSPGRDLTLEEGIAAVLDNLRNRATRLGFLLELGATETGAKVPVRLTEAMATVAGQIQNMHDLVAPGERGVDILAAVEDLNRRLRYGSYPPNLSSLVVSSLARIVKRAPALPAPPAPNPRFTPPKAASTKVDQRTVAAGTQLFRQGDPGDEAYVVERGAVRIVIERGDTKTTVATVERGGFVGEMALIDDQPRMASAIAETEATLTVIPRESFRARLDRIADVDPLIRSLLSQYVDRLRARASSLPA